MKERSRAHTEPERSTDTFRYIYDYTPEEQTEWVQNLSTGAIRTPNVLFKFLPILYIDRFRTFGRNFGTLQARLRIFWSHIVKQYSN